jgi:hypothetical protein
MVLLPLCCFVHQVACHHLHIYCVFLVIIRNPVSAEKNSKKERRKKKERLKKREVKEVKRGLCYDFDC